MCSCLRNQVSDLENNESLYRWIPWLSLAVHPANRGGTYIQGDACLTLLEKLQYEFMNPDEINSMGWCIQERPLPKQLKKQGYQSYLQYNLEKSREQPLLNGCYLESDPVGYGNLGHSHISQVIRAFMRRLHWNIPANTKSRHDAV